MGELFLAEHALSPIRTDGMDWYNTHTGEVIGQTADFRIGALYEIAKLKKEIETKQEP